MGSNHHTGPIRLFPSPDRPPKEKTSVPLSILDATCARFSDTGAVWLFDAPLYSASATSSSRSEQNRIVDHLRSSFATSLDDFPQWAGQLHWAPFRSGGNHTERFQRCMLTYGGSGTDSVDPGVEWSVVRRDYALTSILPRQPQSEDKEGVAWWDNDAFPQSDLVSPAKLALANLKDCEGLPCMIVQITLFACGGYGVGVRLAHPVADAQSMMVFMHKWAANSRGLRRSGQQSRPPSPSLFGEPVFDPSMLDARAAGDIDSADGPDPGLCAKARALPLHRFSWWDTEAPGYSPYLVGTTRNNIPPPEIMAETKVSPSVVAPWHTWDLDRPAASAVLHFTGDELSRLRERARAEAAAEVGQDSTSNGEDTSNISRSDALLAHLFRLITQARCSLKPTSSYAVPAPHDEVFLDFTLEARRRVAPPLPATFLGSPLFMPHIGAPASSLLSQIQTGALARRLRQTLERFTPDAVAALLHDAAFETAPQRLWRGFLGGRHLIVTSWLRTGVYGVDFGVGGASSVSSDGPTEDGVRNSRERPRYVHAVMGKTDGIVVLLDPAVEDDGGVDVGVYLDAEVMGELRELVKRVPI